MKMISPPIIPALLLAAATLYTAPAATNLFSVVDSGFSAYIINGAGNPDIQLVRGFTYTFPVNAPGHPFWIKSVQGTGIANGYNEGVANNGTDSGTVEFSVPASAPDLLFYNCRFHPLMTGELRIIDPPGILITQIAAGSELTVVSTGTDALNIELQSRTNLTEGTWLPVGITGNLHAEGTNTTQAALPPGNLLYLRVRQGFF
jgi:hypothetical protein